MSPDAAHCRQLLAWLAETDIDLLELQGPGLHLRLRRDGSSQAPAAVPAARGGLPDGASERTPVAVRAPGVGLWLSTHPLQARPLVVAGQSVQPGQAVGLLRVGALLLPVSAPVAGRVHQVQVAEGTAVGYGTVLMTLVAP